MQFKTEINWIWKWVKCYLAVSIIYFLALFVELPPFIYVFSLNVDLNSKWGRLGSEIPTLLMRFQWKFLCMDFFSGKYGRNFSSKRASVNAYKVTVSVASYEADWFLRALAVPISHHSCLDQVIGNLIIKYAPLIVEQFWQNERKFCHPSTFVM